jgi:hypothetical protein
MYTRIEDRSVDEIVARASQYLEGESGSEEFLEKLLRAIAHADEDALIFLAKAIADNAEETRTSVLQKLAIFARPIAKRPANLNVSAAPNFGPVSHYFLGAVSLAH